MYPLTSRHKIISRNGLDIVPRFPQGEYITDKYDCEGEQTCLKSAGTFAGPEQPRPGEH